MLRSASSKLFLFSIVFGLMFVIQLGTETVLFTKRAPPKRGEPIITKAENPEGYWVAQGIFLGTSVLGVVLGWVKRRRESWED